MAETLEHLAKITGVIQNIHCEHGRPQKMSYVEQTCKAAFPSFLTFRRLLFCLIIIFFLPRTILTFKVNNNNFFY